MYKCVIFDLDGTILNTLDDLANACNYALRVQGLPEHETEKYRYFAGNGIPKLMERISPEGSSAEALARTRAVFAEYYEAHSLDMTRPYDGITELLDALCEKGIKSVVVTNKDHIFSGKLIEKFFGSRISAYYGGRDGYPRKPDPYWVNTALSEHGIDRSGVLYVGDSGVDMQTAKNAGLFACGVTWGFRSREELIENGADVICDKPAQILELV